MTDPDDRDYHDDGIALGRAQCESTHAAIRRKGRVDGQRDLERACGLAHARGEARGRVQGALIVVVLVGLAVWWRRRA